ncbi:MAG: methylisocitrate lyase [Rhodopirellula sp.]|nr:methylisocitrate lyase [Rhodopirellula sp.]
MSLDLSPGQRFSDALARERPLQVAGTINAYCAKLAEEAGFQAVYLSGAGVANASFGLPDLGMTTLDNVLEDARRITSASALPLLVDCDTGWGQRESIHATVRGMESVGVAAIHLEDQIHHKRCGHRPGKQLVSTGDMIDRLKAATDARRGESLLIMARTDAAAVEGFDAAIERSQQYVEGGADMIFAEALTTAEQFSQFTASVSVPVLANMTEFGRTPLLTVGDFHEAGVALVLYPLSAFRAMSAAALQTYQTLRREGTQQSLLDQMQTRDELYRILDYQRFEQQLDEQQESTP